MIVTADPLGDFNATSQILRYSALAREVTVPRVPSVCESILSSTSGSHRSVSGRVSPGYDVSEELERAAAEISRLSRDCHNLAVKLAEEEIARSDLEMRLRAAEEKCLMIEQDVREECWADMDEKTEEERRRWQKAWDEQVCSSRLVRNLTGTDNSRSAAMTSTLTRRLSLYPVDSKVSWSRKNYTQYHLTDLLPQSLRTLDQMKELKSLSKKTTSFGANSPPLSVRCTANLQQENIDPRTPRLLALIY